MQESKSGMRDRLVKNVAGIAQMIRSEADPSRKAQMVQALISSNPRMGQELSNLGFDPANPDGAMDMILAEARGMTTPSKKDLMTVSPGSTVYDPISGQPVYKAPNKPGADTKFSEGATKAANFANMMKDAEGRLATMAGKDAQGNPNPLQNPLGAGEALTESILPEAAANYTRSPQYQQYKQAAEQWIRAKLRKESGAAIGNAEMAAEFVTYFPQPGDGPGVIESKAAAREQATRGMLAESRGAYDTFFSGEQSAPPPAASPEQVQSPFPEYPNAQQAPDGNWYVEQGGQFFRIDQ
jgi:hypothetical protein